MTELSFKQQVEQCYREHTPGQEQWRRWAGWMRATGRAVEVFGSREWKAAA